MLNDSYDFKKVILTVGIQAIQGFEDGTEIVAERSEDSWTDKTGVDGNMTRSRTNNNSGTITFSLEQHSPSNKYLQTLANLDENTGQGVVPSSIVNNSDSSKERAVATQSWIVKPSSKGNGRESGAREWVMRCADLIFPQLPV